MQQCYESGDFRMLGNFEKIVSKGTREYSGTFQSYYEGRERVTDLAAFFGAEASRFARDNVSLNEFKLMQDKAPVTYDFDLLKEVYDIIANPKKAARTLPASSTGNPSVTSIQ